MSDRRKRYSMMILLVIALLLCYVDRVLISLAGLCTVSIVLFRLFADVAPILVEDCAEQPGR